MIHVFAKLVLYSLMAILLNCSGQDDAAPELDKPSDPSQSPSRVTEANASSGQSQDYSGQATGSGKGFPVAKLVVLENSASDLNQGALKVAVFGRGDVPLSRYLSKTILLTNDQVRILKTEKMKIPPEECTQMEGYQIVDEKIFDKTCQQRVEVGVDPKTILASSCSKQVFEVDLKSALAQTSPWIGLCVLGRYNPPNNAPSIWQPTDKSSWYVFPHPSNP